MRAVNTVVKVSIYRPASNTVSTCLLVLQDEPRLCHHTANTLSTFTCVIAHSTYKEYHRRSPYCPGSSQKTPSISCLEKSRLNRSSCDKHRISNLTKERTRINWQCLVENSEEFQAKVKEKCRTTGQELSF